MAKKSAANRLEAARAALDVATKQIGEIEASRNAALLKDDDATAATLLSELESLRAVARGHTDKIALLETEAKRERAAEIVRGHQALIGRFEKKLGDSDADLTEAADLIGQAWKKILSGIDKREAALAAFSVHSSHARAAATNPDGCAMSAEAICVLLSWEFYRVSARPLMGGRPGERAKPHLPGARPPRIDLQLQPGKIEPFSSKLRIASKFAVDLLRDEIGKGGAIVTDPQPVPPAASPPTNGSSGPPRSAAEVQRAVLAEVDARDRALAKNTVAPSSNGNSTSNAAGAPAEQRERTAAEVELNKLLQRQMELSQDVTPAGEAAYMAVVDEIAKAQDAVDREKGTRT